MEPDYVTWNEGAWQISGTRVSLDSVVYAFLRGESPDGIAESFPALTLEQICGALAFYLRRRGEIDSYLRAGRAEFDRQREAARKAHPALSAKIEAARSSAPRA